MFTNVGHFTALYDHVVAKTGSETSALLLSYGQYMYFLIKVSTPGHHSNALPGLQIRSLIALSA